MERAGESPRVAFGQSPSSFPPRSPWRSLIQPGAALRALGADVPEAGHPLAAPGREPSRRSDGRVLFPACSLCRCSAPAVAPQTPDGAIPGLTGRVVAH